MTGNAHRRFLSVTGGPRSPFAPARRRGRLQSRKRLPAFPPVRSTPAAIEPSGAMVSGMLLYSVRMGKYHGSSFPICAEARFVKQTVLPPFTAVMKRSQEIQMLLGLAVGERGVHVCMPSGAALLFVCLLLLGCNNFVVLNAGRTCIDARLASLALTSAAVGFRGLGLAGPRLREGTCAGRNRLPTLGAGAEWTRVSLSVVASLSSCIMSRHT